MNQYWVEGLFVNAKGVKRIRKSGITKPGDIEPFSWSYWAESPREAMEAATLDLAGGDWHGDPVVTRISEEKKMRAMGAPELPGMDSPPRKAKARK